MKINGHDITAEPTAVPVGEVPKLERLLTVEELAELLKVPLGWVYEKTRGRALNRIPGIKLGKYWRFREADIVTWLEQQKKN